VKEDMELKMKLDALTKKVDALVIGKSINAANPFHVDCCPSVLAPFTKHKLVLLCQHLSSHQCNKLML
jgi:hypothetical protein